MRSDQLACAGSEAAPGSEPSGLSKSQKKRLKLKARKAGDKERSVSASAGPGGTREGDAGKGEGRRFVGDPADRSQNAAGSSTPSAGMSSIPAPSV